jgi:hypothetical protein
VARAALRKRLSAGQAHRDVEAEDYWRIAEINRVPPLSLTAFSTGDELAPPSALGAPGSVGTCHWGLALLYTVGGGCPAFPPLQFNCPSAREYPRAAKPGLCIQNSWASPRAVQLMESVQ